MQVAVRVIKEDFINGVRDLALRGAQCTRSQVCAVSQALLRTGHDKPRVAYSDYATQFDGEHWKIVSGDGVLKEFDNFIDRQVRQAELVGQLNTFLGDLDNEVEFTSATIVFESEVE